jgi:hypothetical protein
MRHIAMVIAGHCLALLFAQSHALAQPIPPCLKSTLPIANEALRYKDRDDRCEGLYMQPVAASSHLRILGYLEHVPIYRNGSDKSLRVSVLGATQTDHIMLHATSARYRQYYQMDAQLPPGSPFPWKRSVLNRPEINLTPGELMVIACEGSCDRTNLHLFPVSIVEDGSAPTRNAPELVFDASVDLAKITLQVMKLPNGVAVSQEVLQGQQLLAGLPKRVALSALIRGAGLYQVRATAIPSYTASVSTIQALIVVP